jgi:oxygen-independent coproporphyrinogen-3 oxidase
VHVPFCAARCSYCDFSSGERASGAVERWLDLLEREAATRAPVAADVAFSSVFLGGGTPSALSARHFGRAWATVTRHFRVAPGAEITLEANPESVRPTLLDAWGAAGVNRLSMGAQSFHADELRRLGRIHGAERPAAAVAMARAHGFRGLSLDLMFGFPGHTPARWQATLERALALDLPHLSAYCFIPEPGTALGAAALAGAADMPDAEAQAEMYARLGETAARAGMTTYETSNLCRPGHEARHNLVYWLRRPYLGLGPSAHSLWGGTRWGNAYALEEWAAALESGRDPAGVLERETPDTVADEILMLGLRLGDGLRRDAYTPGAWAALVRRHGVGLAAAAATGRLDAHPQGWRVPPALRFLADDVIAWVAARAAAVDTAGVAPIIPSPCPSPPSPAI